MQIRPTMTTGAFLAIMLVGPVFQAIGEPSPNVTVAAPAKSSCAELAQLQAPVGHRQPTQNALPPSVREEEAPSAAATPQGSSGDGQRGRLKEQRRTPSGQPFDGVDGVPRICDPC
jgi:hypothetical protein